MKALAFAALAVACIGCGASRYDVARSTLATSARIASIVDRSLAEERVRTAERLSDDPSATREEYRAAMRDFDVALEVSIETREGMLLTQDAIDAAERGESSRWAPMLGCVAVGLGRLVDFAQRRGLSLPDEARSIVEVIRAAGAAACTEAP